jgi:hypothetical protein
MKRSYQKSLNIVANGIDELVPEIPNLDQILKLPHPLREASLVQSICDIHRKSKKSGSKSKTASLAAWIETPLKGQHQDNQN